MEIKLIDVHKLINEAKSGNVPVYKSVMGLVAAELVKQTLEGNDYNQVKAAKELGINRGTLRTIVSKHNIKRHENRVDY